MDQLHKLHDAGGYVKILDITKENDHSKCMLIKGIWNGKPMRMILTGSHNYTDGALEYNNEFLLRLKNSALFKSYWNYYKALQSTLDDFSGWGD
jgi:phosphatidylserine/phosphatidylglycerophosphate/cardiolipin synthase-like enzyme